MKHPLQTSENGHNESNGRTLPNSHKTPLQEGIGTPCHSPYKDQSRHP